MIFVFEFGMELGFHLQQMNFQTHDWIIIQSFDLIEDNWWIIARTSAPGAASWKPAVIRARGIAEQPDVQPPLIHLFSRIISKSESGSSSCLPLLPPSTAEPSHREFQPCVINISSGCNFSGKAISWTH